MCCSRFPRGLDKLYDILDGSWMSAVTGGLYKVCYLITLDYPIFARCVPTYSSMSSLHHTTPSYDFDLQAEEFCHNWEAGIRNAVSHDRLLVLQVMVSLISIILA